ncbi:hypothetical protein BHE74_00043398, partial [Ensete ventricosum]
AVRIPVNHQTGTYRSYGTVRKTLVHTSWSQRVQLRSDLAGVPLRLPSYRLPTRVRIPHLMRRNEPSILHERFRSIVLTEVTMDDRLSVAVPTNVSIPSSYAVQLIFPFIYERFRFIAPIEKTVDKLRVCYRCSAA